MQNSGLYALTTHDYCNSNVSKIVFVTISMSGFFIAKIDRFRCAFLAK